jgi:hypothetical protein
MQSDVTQNVDKAQGECLNQSNEHKWDNIFKKDESFLESDTDEQLLLHIPFNQPIKIHSLCFQAPDDGTAFSPAITRLWPRWRRCWDLISRLTT